MDTNKVRQKQAKPATSIKKKGLSRLYALWKKLILFIPRFASVSQMWRQHEHKLRIKPKRFWLHNLSMIFTVTLLASMMMGLYLNDEWPWEYHNDVVQERQIANAVLQAWPNLSKRDRQLILKNIQLPAKCH